MQETKQSCGVKGLQIVLSSNREGNRDRLTSSGFNPILIRYFSASSEVLLMFLGSTILIVLLYYKVRVVDIENCKYDCDLLQNSCRNKCFDLYLTMYKYI